MQATWFGKLPKSPFFKTSDPATVRLTQWEMLFGSSRELQAGRTSWNLLKSNGVTGHGLTGIMPEQPCSPASSHGRLSFRPVLVTTAHALSSLPSPFFSFSFTYTFFWHMHAHVHCRTCLRHACTHTRSNATVETRFQFPLLPLLSPAICDTSLLFFILNPLPSKVLYTKKLHFSIGRLAQKQKTFSMCKLSVFESKLTKESKF